MMRFVRTMRNGWTAAMTAVVLGFAVLLMHFGMAPMAMAGAAPGGAMPHHGAPPAVDDAGRTIAQADHRPAVQKQTVDAVHQHASHDCAGVVVVHKAMGAPSLVAVLPLVDRHGGILPAVRAARARGPPPWTVLDLAHLCVLRL